MKKFFFATRNSILSPLTFSFIESKNSLNCNSTLQRLIKRYCSAVVSELLVTEKRQSVERFCRVFSASLKRVALREIRQSIIVLEYLFLEWKKRLRFCLFRCDRVAVAACCLFFALAVVGF